jgi:hypothetical protein
MLSIEFSKLKFDGAIVEPLNCPIELSQRILAETDKTVTYSPSDS